MEVKVSELLRMQDLALRSWADELFRLLSAKNCQTLVLDFSGITFMSRSFAHEYLTVKKNFSKHIQETNLNEAVKQMLELASIPPNKSRKDVNRPRIATL